MVKKYIYIILKLISLGMVISAGGLWASARVRTRPKHREEQTLIGGAVWSQTVISIGFLISKIVDEKLDKLVQAFFLVTGVTLLVSTGLFLVVREFKVMNRPISREVIEFITQTRAAEKYDKIYLGIGTLCLLAGMFTLADLLIIMIY